MLRRGGEARIDGVDKESANGFTPLWFAVNKLSDYNQEKENIVQYLVVHGADMDKANRTADDPESEASFWDPEPIEW